MSKHASTRTALVSNYGLGLLQSVELDTQGRLTGDVRTYQLNSRASGVHHIGPSHEVGKVWVSTQGDGHMGAGESRVVDVVFTHQSSQRGVVFSGVEFVCCPNKPTEQTKKKGY